MTERIAIVTGAGGGLERLGGGAILNVSSSAALGAEPYGSPEYAAAKAALIRFTAASAGLWERHRVRMTCVVPAWIGLPRAHARLAAMSPADRARTPPLIPPETVVATGLELAPRRPSGDGRGDPLRVAGHGMAGWGDVGDRPDGRVLRGARGVERVRR
ncbi:NAD(P)-dependent dehydrogenase (short-subunit alcohol dehydrogenase family) [Catenuloplanes nepalensis]|uniref:NAD(P)-dependent dehydrogenase (Short-subunit alcohol dehydrogenase family) n=1 Tax=Catenuloplanes nepalensis TaxID=587533 RepID=A0ABT9MMI8_9ACTN|nr:SDR family NAD(P)-dependent oxidoreductase [Catenuloplanes nepalensis]MDP9792653.1 NAD(P)-dependent dehydrogenase (short-subunit alcohol dehydrogenase family) [Catenuloplanes nepalensis]